MTDPISLKDIDYSNDWLTGRIEEPNQCVEDGIVFDADYLTWGNVARAIRVEEEKNQHEIKIQE